jgi:hypothetical protein
MHASPSFCIAVTDKDVGDGAAVGATVGAAVGATVGAAVGRSVRVLQITYKSPSERRCHQIRPDQISPVQGRAQHSTAQHRRGKV